jgi:DNA-binding MarR family transcriptional regulator
MHQEELRRLFLREKPVLALIAIEEMENAYAAQVAKRIDSTMPHTCNILAQIEAEGLITSRPEGRVNYLKLTDRGSSLVLALRQIMDLLAKPDAMRRRLERLREMAEATQECEAETVGLRLGPLRRDLAKIIEQGEGAMRDEARQLDGEIVIRLSGARTA